MIYSTIKNISFIMQNKIRRPGTVKSIARVAEVLISLSDGTNRITDISNKLNLSKGTVHRLLKTLQDSGFVVQDPVNRRYFLGHLIVRLASSPLVAHQSLTMCAFNEMEYLRDLTGETVELQIRVGMQRMCLEEVPSRHNIRYAMGKGAVSPVYTGSAGKVLLSELSKSELQIIMKNIK